MSTVFDDIKESKAYILGVIAFATAVAGFLTQIWHFAPEPTVLIVAGFAILILFLGDLIKRSEKRQEQALKSHEDISSKQVQQILDSLQRLENGNLENQRSCLRIELTNEIKRHPQNHDTIMKIAERYFMPVEEGGLGGDWYLSSVFLEWAEKEGIRLPEVLKTNITSK